MKSEKDCALCAALCDTNTSTCEQCALFLQSLLRERGVAFHLDVYTDAEAFRESFRKDPERYALLLMSVSFGGENGVVLAESLRAQGCRAGIAFLSETPDRAFDAFRAAPTDYLLQPVTRESLSRLLDRVLPHERGRRVLSVETENGLCRICADDIVYVEVSDRTLAFHLPTGVVSANGSLTALQAALSAERFFRCHKSYLVNLDHVQSIRRYRVQLRDGAAIPIGKSRYLALRSAFTAHPGGITIYKP
ncbi:MAG: LytR/AlgR family response regulator transcription factor [Oscillospiraceae bacterium]